MFLNDPEAAPNAFHLTQEAAPRLGITLQVAPVGAAEELLPELAVVEKHAFRFFVEAGGLMSYGATQSEIYTMAAEQVAKILEGAPPSELPLRQATRFELVINNRTAK